MEEENKNLNEEKAVAVVKNESVTELGTKIQVETTIQDKKEIFNIENGDIEIKLNDIVGQEIVLKDVFMKRVESKLKQEDIEFNEETGEIITDTKISIITILVDEDGKKYVTASKIFAMSMFNLIRTFGVEDIQKGIKIRIIKKSISNSVNKALSFELV